MDILRRFFAILFPGLWIAMIVWYMTRWVEITNISQPYSYILIGVTLLLLLWFVFMFGLLTIPLSKATLWATFASLLVVILWGTAFANNVEQGVYVGDVLTVLWAILTYLSLWWMIVPKKMKQKTQEKKQIIIEV